jgi:hypothetical protein
MLLDADVQAGLVTDRTGALRGMVRLVDIADWMRRSGVRALDATERAAADAADEADDPDDPDEADAEAAPGAAEALG